MRQHLWLYATLLVCVAAAPSTQKQPDEAALQDQLASAQQELKEANRALAKRIPETKEYKVAAQKVAVAGENLRAAQKAGVSPKTVAAASAKLEAQKELTALTKRLETSDAKLLAAQTRVDELTRKLQEVADAKAQEKRVARQAEIERSRAEHAELRKSYDEVLSKPPERRPDITSVPLEGDETNLALVEAKPQNYIDKPFVICGGVRLSDYYNWGYDNAEATHYSLDFRQAARDGRLNRDGNLYQLRSMGDDVLNVLAKREKDGEDRFLLMRFKVTIASRYVRNFDEARAMYEVLDWQFMGRDGKWTAWKSEVGDRPPDGREEVTAREPKKPAATKRP